MRSGSARVIDQGRVLDRAELQALVNSWGNSIEVTATGSNTGRMLADWMASLGDGVYSLADPALGVTGDGDANDTAALQAAINMVSSAGGGVLSGVDASYTYKIAGTLILKNNVIFDLRGSTIFLSTTTSGIKTQSTGKIINGTISAAGVTSYVGPAFLVDDNDGYERSSSDFLGAENVYFIGPGAGASISGTAIKLHGNGGNGITSVRFKNIRISNFDTAIHLYGDTSWVNNTSWSGLELYGCADFIKLERNGTSGNNVSGNVFDDYSIQPNTTTAVASVGIYCNGINNRFSGKIWDWASSGSSVGIQLVSTAKYNVFNEMILSPIYVVQAAIDRSTENYLNLSGTDTYQPLSIGTFLPPTTESGNFIGNADDALAFASSRLTVTSSGDAPTSGSWSNVFNTNTGIANWTGLDSATVKIDFGSTKNYLFGIGVLFGFSGIADNVLVETSTDDATYTTMFNVTGNSNYHVARVGKNWLVSSFRYVRITISNDATKATKVQRICGFISDIQGQAWLPRTGGTVYGSLASTSDVADAVGRLQAVPRSTTTALTDISDAINTTNKFAGKVVINTTTGAIVTANGAAAGDVWLALDGTTAHTPA